MIATRENVKKQFLNCVYELETERFEVIHARDNKTTGFYEAFLHDEHLHEDIAIYGATIAELYTNVKERIQNSAITFQTK
jgi:hypothetical protein